MIEEIMIEETERWCSRATMLRSKLGLRLFLRRRSTATQRARGESGTTRHRRPDRSNWSSISQRSVHGVAKCSARST